MKKLLAFVATVLLCGLSFAVTSSDYSGGVPADQTDDFHGGGGVSPGDDHGGGVPADETDDVHGSVGVSADTPTPLPDGGPYKETVDGIEWTFMVTNGESSIGYNLEKHRVSDNIPFAPAVPITTSGKIVIPSVLGEHVVTRISRYAFRNCSLIESVEIPPTVTDIQENPFVTCYISAIIVSAENQNFAAIDGVLYDKSISNLFAVPGGITGTLVVQDGVTNICDEAVSSCYQLNAVQCPNTLKRIGYCSFYNCQSLESVALPSSLSLIDDWAFAYCYKLNPLIIPDGVISIGEQTFMCCQSLRSVKIPASVTNIGIAAFRYGKVLEVINCDAKNCNYSSIDGVLYNKTITELLEVPMGKRGALNIPYNVHCLSEASFWNSELDLVVVHENVNNIRGGAFWEAQIGAIEFEAAPPAGLINANIEANTAIRYNVAYEDEWLPVIEECGFTNASPYVPPLLDGGPYKETVDGIEWTFFVEDGESVIRLKSPGPAIPESTVGEIVIPNVLGGRKVTTIGNRALSSREMLTSVTIPSSVQWIRTLSFAGCTQLTNVYFEGESISRIEPSAWQGCNWDLIMHVPATWKGRGKTLCGYTVVRDGEEDGVIAANLTVTNVVVQYVLNSVQPEIAVPVSGDTGFTTIVTEVKSAGAVSVPSEWKENYPNFTTKYGNDFGKALMKPTGKKDGAGNDMFVWQDYVAGTDPTNPDDKFTASITMVDGVPVISYTPELSDEQKALREYKTFGKKQLQDKDWTDITDLEGEAKKPYNFFKVTVEMK